MKQKKIKSKVKKQSEQKYQKPLHLNMTFDEAIQRLAQAKPPKKKQA